MVAMIDPVTLNPGGMLYIGHKGSDKVQESPTYTCGHCNRVIMLIDHRTRKLASAGHPSHTCHSCGKWICEPCNAIRECNSVERDAERAFNDVGGQPWLLRHWGQPIDRIFLPDGSERLVLRRDHNLTITERTRYRRE